MVTQVASTVLTANTEMGCVLLHGDWKGEPRRERQIWEAADPPVAVPCRRKKGTGTVCNGYPRRCRYLLPSGKHCHHLSLAQDAV